VAPWLVDGNNVYGSRPDGWWRDRAGAAARLAEEIDRWQRATGEEVVLVFDGRGPTPVPEGSTVVVRHAALEGEATADDLLARLAGEAAGRLTVVTSDRGLVARLPAGTPVEGAGGFLRRLASSRPR
jgi:predicted RNA-binding protein with PIN domain